MADYSILIMMTTYNGEKYIERQLNSIIDQTYSNWNLVVRDDGSKDNTLSILEQYQNKDSRIKIVDNDSKNHGAYYNFFGIVEYAKTLPLYDFYMFSDQDDIWDKNKIERFLNYYSNVKSEQPVLI